MKFFISHSSSQSSVASAICRKIEAAGEVCFLAPRDIGYGKEYAEEIMHGIDDSDAMVLVLCKAANESPHVLREIERAVSQRMPILVYQVEEVTLTKSLEYFLMARQWVINGEGDYHEVLTFVDGLKEEKKEPVESEKNAAQNIVRREDAGRKGEKNGLHTGTYSGLLVLFVLILILLVVLVGLLVWNLCAERREPEETEEIRQEDASSEVEVGASLVFGSYNGEPINWRILSISEDGTEAVLIATDILTMKSYDVAEGGDFNDDGERTYWEDNTEADRDLQLQIYVRGDNTWETSNIRNWLNSSDEVVEYADQEPSHQATSEGYNGYQNEPGFLYGFSEEELAALTEREVITAGNPLADSAQTITRDRVFLLSLEELEWFEDAGMSLLASPTEAAVLQDMSNWYDIDVDEYEIETYYWWLREPVPGTTSQCYMVSNGFHENVLSEANVGTEGFGIRPAIVVDLEADVVLDALTCE